MGRLYDMLDWLGDRINRVLVLSLVIVAGGWVFAELANHVMAGATQSFDDRLILLVRHAETPLLTEVARDITALGGVTVLLLITLAVVGFLILKKKYGFVALICAATVGGLVLNLLLKQAFHRPRPELVPHLSYVISASFPSGHSMLSATVYLTLGALLTRFVQQRRLKFYFLFVAMLLTFLVGVSRVYMGVHYPTDVLAGWTAGLVWAILCWLIARWLQRRGAVESEGELTVDS